MEQDNSNLLNIRLRPFDVFRTLLETYGPQGWWPILRRAGEPGFNEEGYHPGQKIRLTEIDRFEIALGAVLTQNTSWSNVRMSLGRLMSFFDKKNMPLLPEAILGMEEAELANLIRSSGYYRQKARKLRILSGFFTNLKAVPERAKLLKLWGIGPETADSILLYAWDQPFFVIDAYTVRIFSRLTGISTGSRTPSYEDLQYYFSKSLKKYTVEYGEFHALLVRHGKESCRAGDPKCEECSLKKICNYVDKSNLLR